MSERIRVWVQRFADRPNLMLQWTDPATGKRKSKSSGTADPAEAEARRADLEYELSHGMHADPSQVTWDQFREAFEREYLPGRRPGTRKGYRNTLDAFEEICAPKLLRTVSERTLSVFVAGLRARPGLARGALSMASSTIHTRLAYLRGALRWAADQKMMTTCPKFPRVKVPRKRPRPVNEDDFRRLLAAFPDAMTTAFLCCGWLAGLRLAEAWALEWEPSDEAPHLDLARDRIVLPAELVKGDEDQWVPLDPELREALLALPRDGRRVFCFRRHRRVLCAASVGARITAAARRLGIPVTMRTLRRGFGCHYAPHVPAQVLQKLMRHKDIKTTLSYYINVDDAAEEAVRRRRRSA